VASTSLKTFQQQFVRCALSIVACSAIVLSNEPAAATSAASGSSTDQLVERERRRLEELFIWKMSEELKLSVEIETPFAEAIRALNREKSSLNQELSRALSAIEKAKSPKERETALKSYEKVWRQYGELPIKEINRMRPILGTEKLGQYLVGKSMMAEKLKALSTSGKL
jgi:hypothetical protein